MCYSQLGRSHCGQLDPPNPGAPPRQPRWVAPAHTAKEWILFKALAAHSEHISRQLLLPAISQYDAPCAQQALDTHLRRTRQKIEEKPVNPHPILNE